MKEKEVERVRVWAPVKDTRAVVEMVGEMAGVVDRVEVTQGVGVNASTPVEDTVVVPPTTV